MYTTNVQDTLLTNYLFLDICQIRLDFTAVTLQQPTSTTGACSTSGLDTLTITGGGEGAVAAAQSGPPVLCGTLTGSHGE